jgi:hypothetical protein
MDTGVVTIMPANDTGGPTILLGDVRRVRAYLRRRTYGKSGSNTKEGRSMATNYIAKLHLPGGGVRLSAKEAARDMGATRYGGDDPCSGSAAAENTARRVLG